MKEKDPSAGGASTAQGSRGVYVRSSYVYYILRSSEFVIYRGPINPLINFVSSLFFSSLPHIRTAKRLNHVVDVRGAIWVRSARERS